MSTPEAVVQTMLKAGGPVSETTLLESLGWLNPPSMSHQDQQVRWRAQLAEILDRMAYLGAAECGYIAEAMDVALSTARWYVDQAGRAAA